MTVLLGVGCSRPLAGFFNEKIRMLDGGALEIADVAGEDTATYICRAYNGIGDGATREYTLRVNSKCIPCLDIKNDLSVLGGFIFIQSSFRSSLLFIYFSRAARVRFVDEQPGEVTVAERSTARLTCSVEGFPEPRIRWLHNGRDILYDGLRVFLEEDGSTLSIEDVDSRDEGEYTCEAHNGVSEPAQRTTRLSVLGRFHYIINIRKKVNLH